VDDHPLFRAGLRQVIAEDPRFQIVGEAEDGPAALATIKRLQPDVAVLDVNLPGMNGLEVAEALFAERADLALVFLTMLKDEQALNRALNLGAKGYVLKEDAASEIRSCLARVVRGEPYISPALTGLLLRRRSRAEELATSHQGLDALTTAERRILKRVALKQSTREIAAELFVSPRTVEAHRANICAKLSLQGSNCLLQFALEHRDALNCIT
jgi:DNA-binding NarL/FixJ family response regulator